MTKHIQAPKCKICSQVKTFIGKHLFGFGVFYLYEKDLSENVSPLADIVGFNLKITQEGNLMKFSVYSEERLVHVTLIALSEESKRKVDILPYKVDFKEGEVCSGASHTDYKFRKRGLYIYARSRVFPYLKDKGYKLDKFSVSKVNRTSYHVLEKFEPRKTGIGIYLQILGWQFWKERKIKLSE